MRRPWALPLVPLYWAGLAAKNAWHDRGHGVRHLGWPVISVGSLSTGGAGKTPVVLMLADLLTRHGLAVDVLSRGYGRGSNQCEAEAVDPTGTARRFGDEPLLMAQTGLLVFVGAERFAAGKLAETDAPPRIHLLDDGFQHRRLARTLNVVLLTLVDAQDWLLPAGNLRESLRALGRADVIILREEEAPALIPLVPGKEIWLIRRTLTLPSAVPIRPIAFCGIARPSSFFTMLREQGCTPAGEVAFPDHHPYTGEDFASLLATAQQTGADGFITTAKDAVKVSPQQKSLLETAGPLSVAELRVSLAEEDTAWQCIRQALERHEKMRA